MTASRRPRRRPGRSPRDPTPGEMQRTVSLLEATLDSTADGILVVDAQGGVSNYNRRFLEMWRIPPEVAAARPDEGVVEFVLDQLANPDAFCNLTASNADDLVCTDGRVIERDSQPQRLGTEVVGRVWTFRDVTEHRRAERLLADREARLRVIVQSSPECVKLLGPDGTLLDMNPAGLAMIEAGTLDQVRGQRAPDPLCVPIVDRTTPVRRERGVGDARVEHGRAVGMKRAADGLRTSTTS